MKKLTILVVAIVLSAWCQAAAAQSQPSCTSGGTSIATGITTTSFTDSTVVDGQTYGYLVTSNTQFGFACSTIVNAVIPASGTHSVTLNWVASTTQGVTYSVFRAQTPAPPTGLAATVN